MEKKGRFQSGRPAVSFDRVTRLYRLLVALRDGISARGALAKRLKIGVRTLYRDIELLRRTGIDIGIDADGYSLPSEFEDAVLQLPFPDPELTFGEVQQLSRGRTSIHRRLRQLAQSITR